MHRLAEKAALCAARSGHMKAPERARPRELHLAARPVDGPGHQAPSSDIPRLRYGIVRRIGSGLGASKAPKIRKYISTSDGCDNVAARPELIMSRNTAVRCSVVSLAALLVTFGTACGSSPTSNRVLTSMALTPANADAQNFAGGQVQFVANGTFSKPPSPAS